MEYVGKGWFCPICDALISDKRYESGLITCDCHEIVGSNVCISDSRKDDIDPDTNKNWYNFIEKVQKGWIRLYIKEEEYTPKPIFKPVPSNPVPQPAILGPKFLSRKKRVV